MAVPSGTTLSASRVNAREDLQDIIYDISPVDTPVLSRAKQGTAAAKYHEWNTDELAAAATNAHIEGDDSTATADTATVRPGNRTQILKKTAQVSGSSEAIKKAGYKSQMAYQLKKRMKEIKRDLEKAITGNQATVTGSTTVAATMAGIESYLTSNIAYAAAQGGATTAGYSAGSVSAPVDPTATGAFTESLMRTLAKSCWDNGGEPDYLIVGSFNKQQFSQNFAGIANLYRDTAGMSNAQASVLGAADIYITDFSGQQGVKVVADRFSREQSALFLDFEYLEVCYLRPFVKEDLAKTGDSKKAHIVGEVTLAVSNEKAHGKVVGLTTS